MAYCLKRLFLALSLCVSLAFAQARIADPTQPPGATSATGEEANQSAERRLQLMLIPQRGKPKALIGEQEIRLGEDYGDSQLIKISEPERKVLLKGASETEAFDLTPGVEIKRIHVKKSTVKTVKKLKSGSHP